MGGKRLEHDFLRLFMKNVVALCGIPVVNIFPKIALVLVALLPIKEELGAMVCARSWCEGVDGEIVLLVNGFQHPKRKGGQGGAFNTSSESTFESKHAMLVWSCISHGHSPTTETCSAFHSACPGHGCHVAPRPGCQALAGAARIHGGGSRCSLRVGSPTTSASITTIHTQNIPKASKTAFLNLLFIWQCGERSTVRERETDKDI